MALNKSTINHILQAMLTYTSPAFRRMLIRYVRLMVCAVRRTVSRLSDVTSTLRDLRSLEVEVFGNSLHHLCNSYTHSDSLY